VAFFISGSPLEIRTKQDFYNLYNRGLIGNMLRNWTPDQWLEFDRTGQYPVDLIAARPKEPASPYLRYDLVPHEARDYIVRISELKGWPLDHWQFSERAPDHINTLQGEVIRSDRYMHLHYTLHSHKRMRYTLNDPAIARHACGLQAQMLLKQYMDGHSWDTLQYIWDRWPDAIVEFCCYEKPVGVLATNTLFWEARTHY
jgi:hypothetical protein